MPPRNECFCTGIKFIIRSKFVSSFCTCDLYLMIRETTFPECEKLNLSLTLACIFHVIALIFPLVSHFRKHNHILYSALFLHSVLSFYLHPGCKTSTAYRGFIIVESPTTYWPPADSYWFILICLKKNKNNPSFSVQYLFVSLFIYLKDNARKIF